MLKKFGEWDRIVEERALRTLSTDKEYWIEKGKDGKKVALYTHDDMDGIFCAIEMKKWLEKHKFEIVKYGIVNYSEGWSNTTLDPKLINIALDFANMPGDERDELIDWYLDHHGAFNPDQEEKYKGAPVKKLATSSAYEALCIVLGLPKDSLRLAAVDMIDAAKYDEYEVSWKRLLDYNLTDIIKSAKEAMTKKSEGKKDELSLQGRLEFAAAFNQMLKRSDHKTLISVIHNCEDVSIYSIFHTMKAVYPEHNINPKTGEKKDFLKDAEWRLKEMQKRTRGSIKNKKVYKSQEEFLRDFYSNNTIFSDGYALIGDLAFVPTGTWANALRARTIIMEDYEMGVIMGKINQAISDGIIDKLEVFNPHKLKQFLTEDEIYLMSRQVSDSGSVWTIPQTPKFILLQYGGTLQVCAYSSIKEMEGLPRYPKGPKEGQSINDLGVYMTDVLNNFKQHLNYYDPDTSIGQDEITVSGGHGGIGSISNIFGSVKAEKETDDEGNEIEVSKIILTNEGKKYIDLFKNIIIRDLSGINWSFGLKWKEDRESKYTPKKPEMDNKVLGTEDVTTLDKYGKPIPKNESKRIKSFRDFR